ncbi:hypothetical protein L3X38_001340 [Prunus dulcis]|uniref:Reverse transcriptase Ty1/copia-type domain-containing protein n=1 Tax=Prunus dulcis TaxID=3755 RepID=A0AAD4WRT4_PRUDU|nr:hypothetical protein L3X38_001340 [Prunus dulcis]
MGTTIATLVVVVRMLCSSLLYAGRRTMHGHRRFSLSDDIVETENDTGEQLKLQKYLSQEFEMKDLGYLKYFLGIEVARSKNGIFLSQMKYVMDLLTETGMLECKLADTPVNITYAVSVVSQFMHSPSVFHRNAVDQILRYLKSTPRK